MYIYIYIYFDGLISLTWEHAFNVRRPNLLSLGALFVSYVCLNGPLMYMPTTIFYLHARRGPWWMTHLCFAMIWDNIILLDHVTTYISFDWDSKELKNEKAHLFNNIHWYVTTGGRKYRDHSYLHEEKVPLYKGQDLAVGLTSCWS